MAHSMKAFNMNSRLKELLAMILIGDGALNWCNRAAILQSGVAVQSFTNRLLTKSKVIQESPEDWGLPSLRWDSCWEKARQRLEGRGSKVEPAGNQWSCASAC
jgi:hypothetical protein